MLPRVRVCIDYNSGTESAEATIALALTMFRSLANIYAIIMAYVNKFLPAEAEVLGGKGCHHMRFKCVNR
jgi:hypothetical protein